jgi:hypothetical protein
MGYYAPINPAQAISHTLIHQDEHAATGSWSL